MRLEFLTFLAAVAAPLSAAAVAPEVQATPERVVAGQGTVVELKVRVPAGAGPMRAAASSGRFAQAVVEGGQERSFQWTPPEVKHPLLAILAFWVDVPRGSPEVAIVRIPLLGRTNLPVSTDPGAEVVIEIAGSRFGPVKANRRGRVAVPVEVPPGVNSARVLATRGELQTDKVVPIEVPEHQPLVALLSPGPLPSSGGWLVVAGGESLTAAELELTAQGAKVEPEGGAPLRYRVRPEEGATAVSVEVRRLKGKDSARVEAPVVREEPVVVKVVHEPAPSEAPRGLAVHLLAGGFFAGGANRGPAVALGASYLLPVGGGRLAAELEVGLRRATLDARIEGRGTLHSSVLAGPLLASARLTFFERASLSLSGRVGAGVLPFQHEVTSDFQPGFDESKLGLMAFLAAQGAWRLGRMSLLMELRGEYGPAQTARLDAQLGGAGVSFGMRYEP
jgi:hypothetical protein